MRLLVTSRWRRRRRMRFSVTSPPGRRGTQTPRQPAGHYGKWPNWANVLEQPPVRLAGGCARVRRPRPAGPASRKSAVWAEGLAESAPRARPGHHQAASCRLRGCRELSITSLALSAPPRPPRPLSRELRAMGVDTRFPALSAPLVLSPLLRPSNTARPALGRGCGKNID